MQPGFNDIVNGRALPSSVDEAAAERGTYASPLAGRNWDDIFHKDVQGASAAAQGTAPGSRGATGDPGSPGSGGSREDSIDDLSQVPKGNQSAPRISTRQTTDGRTEYLDPQSDRWVQSTGATPSGAPPTTNFRPGDAGTNSLADTASYSGAVVPTSKIGADGRKTNIPTTDQNAALYAPGGMRGQLTSYTGTGGGADINGPAIQGLLDKASGVAHPTPYLTPGTSPGSVRFDQSGGGLTPGGAGPSAPLTDAKGNQTGVQRIGSDGQPFDINAARQTLKETFPQAWTEGSPENKAFVDFAKSTNPQTGQPYGEQGAHENLDQIGQTIMNDRYKSAGIDVSNPPKAAPQGVATQPPSEVAASDGADDSGQPPADDMARGGFVRNYAFGYLTSGGGDQIDLADNMRRANSMPNEFHPPADPGANSSANASAFTPPPGPGRSQPTAADRAEAASWKGDMQAAQNTLNSYDKQYDPGAGTTTQQLAGPNGPIATVEGTPPPQNFARGRVPAYAAGRRLFAPALQRERRAIAAGIGGAPRTARAQPVVLAGRPAVINSSEKVLPTPAGVAVLNRNMQRRMKLFAPGRK